MSNITKISSELGKIAGAFINSAKESAATDSRAQAKDESLDRKSSLIDLSCQRCGASLSIDIDNIQAFCPYCGNKLMIDVSRLDRIISEKEKTKREELKYEHERYEYHIEESRRPGKVRASIILAIVGMLMMIVGGFAGEASGNPDSTWYMVSLLGMFPLLAVPMIWLSDKKDRN